MTASLLTKDALSKLPADLREHIIVENENVYGLTLHMSIGDFERLVAPHNLLDQMRYAVTESEAEALGSFPVNRRTNIQNVGLFIE